MKRDIVNQPTSEEGGSSRISMRTPDGGAYTWGLSGRTEEDHQGDKVAREVVPLQALARIPGDGYHQYAVGRHVQPPEAVAHLGRVYGARLELKVAIVTGEEACEADEHLAERRVDVKVELALDVVRTKFAEVGLA